MDLNEFFPEQLSKLPGKYLGQYVHKAQECLNEILKITNPADKNQSSLYEPQLFSTLHDPPRFPKRMLLCQYGSGLGLATTQLRELREEVRQHNAVGFIYFDFVSQ